MKKIIGHFVVLVLLSSAVVFLHAAIEHSADHAGVTCKASVGGKHNNRF